MRKKIRKILISNRGEIALRIIRTCKEMGIRSVAVYSEADRASRHVREADEAYFLGGSSPLESYLSVEKILKIAQIARCDAIHPGYGFLSENAHFARRVERTGLSFIGPSAKSISSMGDKVKARRLMRRAGVPIIPGSEGPVETIAAARRVAGRIGFPVLLKAVGGGGGKGMRVVDHDDELARAFRGAQKEAHTAFGDHHLYIEKLLRNPRHVEVQVLGDLYENLVHLGERECSIQRRFQKIIEESPSTYLDEKLRAEMTQAALKAAMACNYVNAGTVEFLMDSEKNYYFLEMNTRIQVEHAVTEMRTGIDLIQEQILITSGEPLRWKQKDIVPRGHAIECRIYAEDPENDFMPSVGHIACLRPCQGNGIRIDSALEEGMDISLYYDPLIAKLISWGQSREQAISRMKRALSEYLIARVKTTVPFCLFVMSHPAFAKGNYDTRFIPNYFLKRIWDKIRSKKEMIAAISTILLSEKTSDLPQAAALGKNGWAGWKSKRLDQFLLS